MEWPAARVIVAATGPSLTPAVTASCRAAQRRGWRVIAVNDAYRVLPSADVLYACDAAWWHLHKGVPGFAGVRWSSHGSVAENDKTHTAREYGVRLVAGTHAEGFVFDGRIGYGGTDKEQGSNSAFQAVNLALLFGAARVVTVGLDLHRPEGQPLHFFGNHPSPFANDSPYPDFVAAFTRAARLLPSGPDIINATPGSALAAFPQLPLPVALEFATPC